MHTRAPRQLWPAGRFCGLAALVRWFGGSGSGQAEPSHVASTKFHRGAWFGTVGPAYVPELLQPGLLWGESHLHDVTGLQ